MTSGNDLSITATSANKNVYIMTTSNAFVDITAENDFTITASETFGIGGMTFDVGRQFNLDSILTIMREVDVRTTLQAEDFRMNKLVQFTDDGAHTLKIFTDKMTIPSTGGVDADASSDVVWIIPETRTEMYLGAAIHGGSSKDSGDYFYINKDEIDRITSSGQIYFGDHSSTTQITLLSMNAAHTASGVQGVFYQAFGTNGDVKWDQTSTSTNTYINALTVIAERNIIINKYSKITTNSALYMQAKNDINIYEEIIATDSITIK
jgi:hypothetical protein